MKLRSRTLLIALAASAGLAACAALDIRRAHHLGPPSDHFDGLRFFDPKGTAGKGLADVLWWRLTSEHAEWPEAVPLPGPTAKPAARVAGDALQVTFVGHATVLVQTAGLNILTDPIWSERASLVSWAGPRRVTPPGIAFDDLPPIDLVLVSHNHYDHMDLPTLARLRAAHDPLFIMPLGNALIAHAHDPAMRIRELDWWQSQDLADGVRVHAVPVYHWSRRSAFDRNKALWSGFAIETPGGALYYAGDTGFGDGDYFRQAALRFGGFRLALLPVGAYEPRWFMHPQHLNPDEAVRVHQLLRARRSIGVHLRTFQLTDEAIDRPDAELQQALQRHEVPAARFTTLPIGGSWAETPPATVLAAGDELLGRRLAGASVPRTTSSLNLATMFNKIHK
jgi:L-ascorbate metabolism protein UlaG (beta-lactamase superfamily)